MPSALKRLPIPKIISFDAFGTLYTPKEPVSTQYFNIAKHYINDLDEVPESQVVDAIKYMRSQYPNYGKTSGMSQEQWWNDVIKMVFVGKKYDQSMIKDIFDHFVDREAYHVYEDVFPLLKTLQQRYQVRLIVCSNSDDRLKQVLSSLELSKFFAIHDIYLSYDLNCSKPDLQFFGKIVQDMRATSLSSEIMEVSPNSWWHCGDDYLKDYKFAIDNGIRGVLVDRGGQTHDLHFDGGGDNIIVSDLRDLVSLLE